MALLDERLRRRLANVRARLRPGAGGTLKAVAPARSAPPAPDPEIVLKQQREALGRLRQDDLAAADAGQLRSEFFALAKTFTPAVIADAKGIRYFVPTDDSFSRQLFVKQERREMRLLARVQHGLEQLGIDRGRRTLLDVGGNIGTGPVEAVCRQGFEHAIAFEPHPGNYAICQINVILNDAGDRVTLVNAAVADQEGSATLQVSRHNSGAHSLSGADVGAIDAIEVPTVSFDGMAARGELDPDSVSLLWMDIEGYEIHALQGGRCLLERSVPFVMELNPPVLRAAGRADQLLDTLAGRYTNVVNLRDFGKRLNTGALQPLDAIDGMLQDAEEKAMDILVCRLP
ncbi:MAG TPA: FkbM family methyltransferase [Thermoleophilaceae bacterium]